jgi:hypothetical protein
MGLIHAIANVRPSRILAFYFPDHFLVRCHVGAREPARQVHRSVYRYVNLLSSACCKFSRLFADKTPEERAKLLETTPLFADIHAQAASSGQSAVPTNLDTDLHFTCFVAAPSSRGPGSEDAGKRLIELDGRRNGPIDRGECTDLLAVRLDAPQLFFYLKFPAECREGHPGGVHE